MFGLEASDAADNKPEAQAIEAVQLFSLKETFDVDRLYEEHKLEKYQTSSDIDDLACDFSGFNFFSATPEKKTFQDYAGLIAKIGEFGELAEELKTKPAETDAILDEFLGETAMEDVIGKVDTTDEEFLAAHERLKDRVELMAHSGWYLVGLIIS